MSSILAILLPLIGFLITGLSCRIIKPRMAEIITSCFMVIATIASISLLCDVWFNKVIIQTTLFEWININTLKAAWEIRLDMLSAIMIVVVNFVSSLVHIYSIGYMHEDKSRTRFMAYLSLFTFCMLMLITSNNLLQLFFGWEGVGLSSYLLIGFWYYKDSARKAAVKAFLVNRVADLALIIALCLIYNLAGSMEFDDILSFKFNNVITILGHNWKAIDVICLLLAIGAFGKSAQLGFHVWLPDAMEGPTPVSALIHAATMVTAGIFLIVRCSPLFELSPFALNIILVVGSMTSIFAALVALTQKDIKKIIAYSTCSQLGYMFFACGISAYNAAMFHLITHAFFKALLFLSAGNVIHAVHNEQNIFNMGSLYKKLPITHAMMWIGALALCGIFPFAGYYSKDLIIAAAYHSSKPLSEYTYFVGILVAFLTAFYSFRLIINVFYGKANYSNKVARSIHEAPLIMNIPLIILSILSVIAGYVGEYLHITSIKHFWHNVITILPHNNSIKLIKHELDLINQLPLIVALSGIILAYICYGMRLNIPNRTKKIFLHIYKILENKCYFDEIYDFIFIRLYKLIANLAYQMVDSILINRMIIGKLVRCISILSKMTKYIQTGFIYHYVACFVIASLAIITYYNFTINLN